MIAPLTRTTDEDPARRNAVATQTPTSYSAMGGLGVDHTWWAHARCNTDSGKLSELFFSDELQDIARAKNICATCPAMIPCLEGALERREPWGVWGGQLFVNGKILTSKRRRGRPPKQPRPEDELPVIPIPVELRDVASRRIA